ncbi:MAG TPA: GNAT family protein [Vicinamibacterales bacterium]|jgi:RimJ/RimL family protein N-acetyltransferase|nr:GNAT family protein [Vicinamibacterales bacterium]
MNTHIASNQQTMTNLEPIRFDAPGTEPIMEVVADWTKGLPIFKGKRMMLRELVKSDATTLLTMLASEEVAKFISPPPTTPEGFEKFIAWAIRGREAGNQMMFGIVPEGFDHAVGLVQIRAIAPRFSVAEWGFAIGSPFWGTGLFLASAKTAVDFAFQHTDVNRLEARAVVQNGRGNGALRKMGAVQEGVLRGSLLRDGKHLDQIMWSIVARDWFQAKAVWDKPVN